MSHLVALTRGEREVMNVVFALGNRASAEAIRARLTDPPTDSSVRVMLARAPDTGSQPPVTGTGCDSYTLMPPR